MVAPEVVVVGVAEERVVRVAVVAADRVVPGVPVGGVRAREREDGTRSWCEEEGIPTGVVPEPEDTGDIGDGLDDDGDTEVKGGCACSTGGGAGGLGAVGALGLLVTLRRKHPYGQ